MLKRIVLYTLATVTILVATVIIWYFATRYTVGSAQEGYLALTRATVLIGENLEPRSSTSVLIQDGTIIQIGDEDEIDIPAEATTLDLSGYTLMPGLMDLHVHLASPEVEVGQQPSAAQISGLVLDVMRYVPGKRRAFLNHGVTTIRDLGNEYQWVMEFRQLLRDGELEGPRLFAAGPIFTTPGGHPVVTIGVEPQSDAVRLPATPDDARRAVQGLVGGDDGVDLIKVVQERGRPERALEPIQLDVLRAIVAEAHDQGLPVTAHWGTLEDLEDVLAAGVDGLEHLEPRGALEGWPDDVLNVLVERDVSITPTLTVTEVVLPPQIMQELRRRVGEFHAAGGRVVVGTDAGMPGVPFGAGVHRELELLVESGLTPQEALKAATSEAAKVLRTEHIGVILPGRAADLVVVDGNPLQEIQATRNVVMVFRDGRLVVDRRGEKQSP